MEKPFVSCHFIGQLGNQLFIAAATLAYAWDYGARAIFPGLHEERYRLSYHRDRLFFRLDTSAPTRPFGKEYWQKYWFSPDRIPYCEEDLFLYGYFQSWKHFHHHREKLLSIFAPHPQMLEDLYRRYGDLIKHPCTVAVHVRTNSQKTHPFTPFLGLSYLRDSMEQFPGNAKFVVFSDRINWCKHHVPSLGKDCVFIEGTCPVEDLILMSMMKHTIMANSTFSWWGAYLNQNPGQKIVVPSIVSVGVPTDSLYFPEWTVIPAAIHPYPSDMCSYDKLSQSMDNND